MTDFQRDHFSSLIPSTFTPLQKAIALSYVDWSCTARIGAGPRFGDNTSNDDATPDCRICGLSLAGELTLRHTTGGFMPNQASNPHRACQRTFHLECLVEWAEGNLHQDLPITCPQDRQMLIPPFAANHLRAQFEIPDPPVVHTIREIDRAIKWWDTLNPDSVTLGYLSVANIAQMDPVTMLEWAANGFDVGFMTADVLALLVEEGVLAGSLKNLFHQFYSQLKLARKDGSFPGRVYHNWVYVQIGRRLSPDLHDQGVEEAQYVWVPMTAPAFDVFRRYLLGLMGEAWSISMLNNRRVAVRRDRLKPRDIVSVHAEKEIRKLMKNGRKWIIPPETAIWYWPFDYRGITVGGGIPGVNYPPTSYNLRDINISYSNDQRFKDLLADPVAGPMARRNNDEIVNRFKRGELPSTFPQRSIVAGLEVRVPLYQVDAEGQSRLRGVDLTDTAVTHRIRRDPATLPQLFPIHSGLNDPSVPVDSSFIYVPPRVMPAPDAGNPAPAPAPAPAPGPAPAPAAPVQGTVVTAADWRSDISSDEDDDIHGGDDASNAAATAGEDGNSGSGGDDGEEDIEMHDA